VVGVLDEGAIEVRNQAKIALLTLDSHFPNKREFDSLLLRCNLSDRQVEQVRKVREEGNLDQLSNFINTKYGGSMRGSSLDSRGFVLDNLRRTPLHPALPNPSGSDGFDAQNSSGNMQLTFLSGGAPQPQRSNATAQSGFGVSGQSGSIFKKRQQSVSKPLDPQFMENFKNLVAQSNTNDWSQRLQAVNEIGQWVQRHSGVVQQHPPSKFIQLLDVYCKLVQDNNAKVQSKAMSGFQDFLQNPNVRQLVDHNLTMIVQALAANLSSNSFNVKSQNEALFNLLEETTETPSQLVQPLVAQINLPNNRSKPQLIQRLTDLVARGGPWSVVERYVVPLTLPQSKLQSEGTVNPKLREALRTLEQQLKYIIKK